MIKGLILMAMLATQPQTTDLKSMTGGASKGIHLMANPYTMVTITCEKWEPATNCKLLDSKTLDDLVRVYEAMPKYN